MSLALGLLALLSALLRLLAGEAGALALVAKPLPVLCLLLLALRHGRGAYPRALAAGFLASATGDLLLDLPGLFLQGLLAFLVAHLCYATAFTLESRRLALARALPFAALVGTILAGLWPGLGSLRLPVAVYACGFLLTLWRAAACLGATVRGRRAELLALLGALAFAASDSLIGLTRFRGPLPGAGTAILSLYWTGQALIAASVVRDRAPD
jgi:uncharacterized membrane protein YhhN